MTCWNARSMALARALPPRTVPEAYCMPSDKMAGWNCCLVEDDDGFDYNGERERDLQVECKPDGTFNESASSVVLGPGVVATRRGGRAGVCERVCLAGRRREPVCEGERSRELAGAHKR